MAASQIGLQAHSESEIRKQNAKLKSQSSVLKIKNLKPVASN